MVIYISLLVSATCACIVFSVYSFMCGAGKVSKNAFRTVRNKASHGLKRRGSSYSAKRLTSNLWPALPWYHFLKCCPI